VEEPSRLFVLKSSGETPLPLFRVLRRGTGSLPTMVGGYDRQGRRPI
jgi:hypothetical protein